MTQLSMNYNMKKDTLPMHGVLNTNANPQPIAFVSTVLFLVLGSLFSGCQTARIATTEPSGPKWLVYEAQSGSTVEWDSFIEVLAAADIVTLGEQHNNVLGHEIEAKIVAELLERQPSAAVAMEMFERNEQGIVDLYLDDHIQQKTLIKITSSANWGGGKDTWVDWYQPIVDHVKSHRADGATLVAANSARPFVTLARMDGFEPLELLKEQGNDSFTIPDLEVDDLAYKERFIKLMTPSEEPPEEEKKKSKKKGKKKSPPTGHGMDIDPETVFRAQQIWDASMADSVVRASKSSAQVILIIGDYHSSFEGGTLTRIKHHAAEKKVISVSIVPADEIGKMKEEDNTRADFVIYTQKSSG